MANRKVSTPYEYRTGIKEYAWGTVISWQHHQEEGEDVYKREFTNTFQLGEFLVDRYGVSFSKKIVAAVNKTGRVEVLKRQYVTFAQELKAAA